MLLPWGPFPSLACSSRPDSRPSSRAASSLTARPSPPRSARTRGLPWSTRTWPLPTSRRRGSAERSSSTSVHPRRRAITCRRVVEEERDLGDAWWELPTRRPTPSARGTSGASAIVPRPSRPGTRAPTCRAAAGRRVPRAPKPPSRRSRPARSSRQPPSGSRRRRSPARTTCPSPGATRRCVSRATTRPRGIGGPIGPAACSATARSARRWAHGAHRSAAAGPARRDLQVTEVDATADRPGAASCVFSVRGRPCGLPTPVTGSSRSRRLIRVRGARETEQLSTYLPARGDVRPASRARLRNRLGRWTRPRITGSRFPHRRPRR